MKFGLRKPSFKKRVAARTSWKRAVRHNLGFKAPRGWGWLTNPKKAAYNRVYNRTAVSVGDLLGGSKGRSRTSTGGDTEGCGVLFLVAAVFGILAMATSFAAAIAITAAVALVAGIVKIRSAQREREAALQAQAAAQRLEEAQARGLAAALEARHKDLHARFGKETTGAILRGEYWLGATSEMVCESLGAPVDVRERVLKTKTKTTYCYRKQGRGYELKIYFENGIVVGWDD